MFHINTWFNGPGRQVFLWWSDPIKEKALVGYIFLAQLRIKLSRNFAHKVSKQVSWVIRLRCSQWKLGLIRRVHHRLLLGIEVLNPDSFCSWKSDRSSDQMGVGGRRHRLEGVRLESEPDQGFSGGLSVKNLPTNAGDGGLTPASRRSPGEGNGNPLRYSCLENSEDRGAWRASVHGVAKSQTRLSTRACRTQPAN